LPDSANQKTPFRKNNSLRVSPAEIVESLQTVLDRFRNVAKALGEGPI
jgi:hypothetical protein